MSPFVALLIPPAPSPCSLSHTARCHELQGSRSHPRITFAAEPLKIANIKTSSQTQTDAFSSPSQAAARPWSA